MGILEGFCEGLRRCGVSRGPLGLAVSGGADSTALLHLAAAALAADRLHVLHVDHGLHPQSADHAEAVRAAAASLGVACSVLRVEVGGRGGVEAAARRARYAALERAAAALRLPYVATAHTLDDQAETVLLRALRGTGPGGLAAIRPVAGRFVRPLLWTRRAELRAWLGARGIGWVEDPTNDDPSRERNWLRREILSRIEARRPSAPAALARLASLIQDDAEALEELAAARLAAARELDGCLVVPADALGPPRALASRVVRALVPGADARAVEGVLSLQPGGSLTGPGGVVVGRVRGHVMVVRRPPPPPAPLRLPRRGVVEDEAWGVRVRVGGGGAPWAWRCSLDACGPLWLRGRRPGDRVPTPGGTRKVQDVLVDAKVPRPLRDRVPVLAAGEQAVAVVGLTAPPGGGAVVVDVEPTREAWWTLAMRRS